MIFSLAKTDTPLLLLRYAQSDQKERASLL